jgi:hypothetical protein
MKDKEITTENLNSQLGKYTGRFKILDEYRCEIKMDSRIITGDREKNEKR